MPSSRLYTLLVVRDPAPPRTCSSLPRPLDALGVCVGQPDGTATFQRYNVGGGSVRIGGSLTIGGDKFRVDQTRLESYCYELVETHEDQLSEVVRPS